MGLSLELGIAERAGSHLTLLEKYGVNVDTDLVGVILGETRCYGIDVGCQLAVKPDIPEVQMEQQEAKGQ
jgi:hypothetical protein